MPPKKSTLRSELADQDGQLGQLLDAVATLTDQVRSLTDEVQVLRTVVDDIRDDFGWALNNRDQFQCIPGIHPLTSMPLDPLGKDFGERINKFTATDSARDHSEAAKTAPPSNQGELWQ